MHEKRLKIVEYDPDFNKEGTNFYLKLINSRRRMTQNILKSIIYSVCLMWVRHFLSRAASNARGETKEWKM